MEKDRLKDLKMKSNPYIVPEGYFESFKEKAEGFIQSHPKTVQQMQPRRLFVRLASAAAALLLLIAASVMFLGKSSEDPSEISEEDIVAYLIYSGISEEMIEYSKE